MSADEEHTSTVGRARDVTTRMRESLDDDKFHDECGVFGIHGHADASSLTYLGLYGLQHRGQESAGIAAADGGA